MTRHNSMRGWFAYELYQQMKKDKSIILLTGDLGYGMFDAVRDEMPKQFINCGAAEQAMMGIAVGLALEGKKPFVYSITTFLLYRPFETIRLYINHESIPVRLVGGGRDKDYAHDGISHWSEDARSLFEDYVSWESFQGDATWTNKVNKALFKNIKAYWPETKEEIPELVERMVKEDKPQFISLKR